jgi:hypothetical protein
MRRVPARLLLPLAAAAAALAGCAQDGPFPSLAVRPAERQYAEEARREPTAPAALPDDPAVAERVAALAAEARRGESEFDEAYRAAAALAARAGAAGSDIWSEAQQALSRAAAARGRTTAALADLDAFALDQAGTGKLGDSDLARLGAATAEIQALADSQAERVNRLEASLSRG